MAEQQTQRAIVVILDVLGVSTLSIEACKEFISKREKLIAAIKERNQGYLLPLIKGFFAISVPEPEFITFGDTILIIWQYENPNDDANLLMAMALILKQAFVQGLRQHNLILRGAISTGELIRDQTTVLGPAVADAASWYSKGDWIGIIATPQTGMKIAAFERSKPASEMRSVFDSPPEKILSPWYVQYPVPLTDKREMELWCLAWPADFLHATGNIEAGRFAFFEALSKCPIPIGTEKKYLNTVNFFKWFDSSVDRTWWPETPVNPDENDTPAT